MSFTLYRYVWPETGSGEYWRGEVFEDHLALTQYQTIVPTILKYLPKQGRILEAGCGLGRWVVYLQRLGYTVIGMEVSLDALTMAHGHDTSLQFQLGDVAQAPYVDESFDAITSFGVVEHFESGPGKCLAEAHRLIKKNGFLLITVPYQNALRKLVLAPSVWLVGTMLQKLGFQRQFSEYRFSKRDMLKFLEEAGFEVLRVEPDDFKFPKSLGLYADWGRIMGSRDKNFELNTFGKIIQRFLSLFSLWLYCEAILLVAKKK